MANNNGIYVWRDPQKDGTPIGSGVDVDALISFCNSQGTSRILYDNYGNGDDKSPDRDSKGVPSDDFFIYLNELVHNNSIKIEALFTDKRNFSNVIGYNNKILYSPWWSFHWLFPWLDQSVMAFDGIRMDYEGPEGHLPGWEPTTPDDIKYYADAKTEAADLPLNVSIGWHWGTQVEDPAIQYTHKNITKTQRAYKHILDIVDGVDIQTAWGNVPGENIDRNANVIAWRVQPIVCYANLIKKPAWVTIETFAGKKDANDPNKTDIDPMNTFHDEGEKIMKDVLALVSAKLKPLVPAGFIYHFYRRSFGSGQALWPSHP